MVTVSSLKKTYMTKIAANIYNAIFSQMQANPNAEIKTAKGICAAFGFEYDNEREHKYYAATQTGRKVKFCLRDELGLTFGVDFHVRPIVRFGKTMDEVYTTGAAVLAFLNKNNLIQGVNVSTKVKSSKSVSSSKKTTATKAITNSISTMKSTGTSYISTLSGISEKMKINRKKIKTLKSDVKITGLNNILNYFGLSYGKMVGAVNGPLGKDILSTIGLEEDETFFVENNRYYTYSDMLKSLC